MRAQRIRLERPYNPRIGFSLIELVIVVVIIAIIGAIAIPKLSRGSAGGADASLIQDLSVLRTALDHYQAEHGGTLPTTDMINAVLTLYTGSTGTSAQSNPDATHIYGPYLRAIPPLPVGAAKGGTGIGPDVNGTSTATNIGWLYNPSTGTIRANTTTEADASGKLYSTY